MAMALAARGDFFATSAAAVDGVAVALTAVVLAGEFLVALVTDGVAVFAVVVFLAEGEVLTGVLDTWPCRGAVEVLATAFLTGADLEGLEASTGFFAEAFLVDTGFLTVAFWTGTAFLATAFFTGTAFLTTAFFTGTAFLTAAFFTGAAFLATAFLAGAVGFLAGTDFLAAGLATGFFTADLDAEAALLATVFLTGALATGFDLPLALAFCLVDFTAYLLSAGPGEFK